MTPVTCDAGGLSYGRTNPQWHCFDLQVETNAATWCMQHFLATTPCPCKTQRILKHLVQTMGMAKHWSSLGQPRQGRDARQGVEPPLQPSDLKQITLAKRCPNSCETDAAGSPGTSAAGMKPMFNLKHPCLTSSSSGIQTQTVIGTQNCVYACCVFGSCFRCAHTHAHSGRIHFGSFGQQITKTQSIFACLAYMSSPRYINPCQDSMQPHNIAQPLRPRCPATRQNLQHLAAKRKSQSFQRKNPGSRWPKHITGEQLSGTLTSSHSVQIEW